MSFNIRGVSAIGGALAGGVNRWRAGRLKSATGDTIKSIVTTVGASTVRTLAEASVGALTLAIVEQSLQPWQSGSCDSGGVVAGAFIASAQSSGIAVCEFGSLEPPCSTMEPDWGQKPAQARAGPAVIAAARIIAKKRRKRLISVS